MQLVLALEELEQCVSSTEAVAEAAEEKLLAETIERFLLACPERERKIFVGRYWHLYSIAELASAYGMSESRVTSLLFRMRKKLRVYLEKEEIFP